VREKIKCKGSKHSFDVQVENLPIRDTYREMAGSVSLEKRCVCGKITWKEALIMNAKLQGKDALFPEMKPKDGNNEDL